LKLLAEAGSRQEYVYKDILARRILLGQHSLLARELLGSFTRRIAKPWRAISRRHSWCKHMGCCGTCIGERHLSKVIRRSTVGTGTCAFCSAGRLSRRPAHSPADSFTFSSDRGGASGISSRRYRLLGAAR
jgi:hypothetical protein